MNPSRPEQHVLRILQQESAGSAEADALVQAAERVLRAMQVHLARWFGPDGVTAVLNRALARARVQHPVLSEVELTMDGQLTLHLRSSTAQSAGNLHDALVALISAAVVLLERLIGEDLVMRLLEEMTPGTLRSAEPGSPSANTEPE